MKNINIIYFSTVSFLYVVVLCVLSLILFRGYSNPFDIALHQVFWTFFFFMGAHYFNNYWKNINEKGLIYSLFGFSLLFNIFSVFWYYYIYMAYTGTPFEALYSDQMFYDEQGENLSYYILDGDYFPRELFKGDFSDFGYPYFLGVIYAIFGQDIFIVRLIQALLSSITVVFVYKIARSFFNSEISKIAGILMMLSPILIRFTTTHLKETVMLFFIVLGTYNAILFLKTKNLRYVKFMIAFFSFLCLLTFRTVTSLIFVFSFFLYFVYQPNIKNSIYRYLGIPVFILVFVYALLSSPADEEISDSINKGAGYSESVLKVSSSKSLSKVTNFPVNMSFAIFGPFPNMLDKLPLEPDRMFFQQLISADTMIKSVLGFFLILGLYYVFRMGFRKNIFLLSIILLNITLVAFTGVMLNLRHYLPFYPFILIFVSVGIYYFSQQQKRYYIYYLIILLCITIFFNFLKLSDFDLI